MITNFISITVGCVLIVSTVFLLIINMMRTPRNLKKYYGIMYATLSIAAVIGGIALIIFGVTNWVV